MNVKDCAEKIMNFVSLLNTIHMLYLFKMLGQMI